MHSHNGPYRNQTDWQSQADTFYENHWFWDKLIHMFGQVHQMEAPVGGNSRGFALSRAKYDAYDFS